MSCPPIPPGEHPATLDREILDVAKAVIAVNSDDAFQKARALFREMMERDDILGGVGGLPRDGGDPGFVVDRARFWSGVALTAFL